MSKWLAVSCIFVGLIGSFLIVYADDRGIVIDDIVTETGTPAWEYAFLIYTLFFTGGVVTEMVTVRRKGSYDFGNLVVLAIALLLSFWGLEQAVTATTGNLATAFTNMRNEFYNWGIYITALLAIYVTHMFTKR